uniref:Uncharacterized protein n=1 Tax=Salmonella sp. TaxID=599 RepID=A0A482ETI6_SALSP|nr:hypothetical protein NNIBIDOC_00197 [Salmonella sp.]
MKRANDDHIIVQLISRFALRRVRALVEPSARTLARFIHCRPTVSSTIRNAKDAIKKIGGRF